MNEKRVKGRPAGAAKVRRAPLSRGGFAAARTTLSQQRPDATKARRDTGPGFGGCCCGSRGGLVGGRFGSGATGVSAARSASILRRAAAGKAVAAEAPQS